MPRQRFAIGPMFGWLSLDHMQGSWGGGRGGCTRENPYTDVMVGSRDAC